MKNSIDLNTISSDEGLEMLAKISPHIDVILHDAEYNKIRLRVKENKNLTMQDIMGDAYTVIAMKNRAALYGIVGSATGKTEKEIAEQPLEETLSVFQGVMGSRIIDFFIFCAHMVVRL